MLRQLLFAFPMVLICLSLSSCNKGDGITKYKLSGEVLFDGEPLPYGEMLLSPDAEKNNLGPSSTITIVDGKFESPPDKGHIGGPYVAVITGFDGETPKNPDPLRSSLRGNVLFENFETKFELPMGSSTQKIEVSRAE